MSTGAHNEADPNAPWLTAAHTLCTDHGIPPGHIQDRLEALRTRLAAPLEGAGDAGVPAPNLWRKLLSELRTPHDEDADPEVTSQQFVAGLMGVISDHLTRRDLKHLVRAVDEEVKARAVPSGSVVSQEARGSTEPGQDALIDLKALVAETMDRVQALCEEWIYGDASKVGRATEAVEEAVNNLALLAAPLSHPASPLRQEACDAAASERCPYCDNTGDVHSADGEWRGECTVCAAAPSPAPAPHAGQENAGPTVTYGRVKWCDQCGEGMTPDLPCRARPANENCPHANKPARYGAVTGTFDDKRGTFAEAEPHATQEATRQDERELPPLPPPKATTLGDEYESFDKSGRPMGRAYENIDLFSAEQMHSYARAAMAAGKGGAA